MKKEDLTRYHTYDDWYTGYEVLEFPPQTTENHNSSLDTHVEESDAEWYSIEEVDKLLDFNGKQLSETEEKLKDVYREVLEDIYYDYKCPEYGGVTELCRYCEEEKGHKHDTDCIVLEAQNWLEDKE